MNGGEPRISWNYHFSENNLLNNLAFLLDRLILDTDLYLFGEFFIMNAEMLSRVSENSPRTKV